MKFTNNRKKAVNLSAKSSGRYNWENASVVFEKEIRKYKKENESENIKTHVH